MSMYDIGFVRRKRVTQQSSMMFGQSIAAGGFDAATLAWVAAVFAVDGTVVSTPQKTLVDNLIVGLKADGLFTKLDRLWLFAIENQTEALVDIVGDALATAVSAPTFTIDRGYNPGASGTTYIDPLFNPTTFGGKFTADSCHMSVYVRGVTTTTAFPTPIGGFSGFQCIIQSDALNNFYAEMNDGTVLNSSYRTAGMMVLTRHVANAKEFYGNGSSIASDGSGSAGLLNTGIFIGTRCDGGSPQAVCGYDQDIAAASFGGGLTATDAANLSSRINTYMTAVGANVY